MGGLKRVNVLGVGVHALNMKLALEVIEGWIAERRPNYVCVTGVHGVIECQDDPELRDIHNRAGLVTPDGMPMVWLSRLHGHRWARRVYGPDLMLELCARGVGKGYRHFLYGGAPGIPQLLSERLERRLPGIRIVGAYSPPFRPLTPEEDAEVVARIDDTGADVVWVGLSTPKQERWASAHLGRLKAPVTLAVGAAFDFHAGVKRQAPRWMQRGGLEWLFRMLSEPRRLAPRYLVNNPRFLWLLMLQGTGLRRVPLSRPDRPGSMSA